MRTVLFVLAVCGLSAGAAWGQAPEPSREAITRQQMHGYLDTLIEIQLKLQESRAELAKRESEWSEYSKPLWGSQEHASK